MRGGGGGGEVDKRLVFSASFSPNWRLYGGAEARKKEKRITNLENGVPLPTPRVP